MRDVIIKSVTPINDKHTLEVLLIDTQEDYTRGVTHVAESPNFEDTALQDSEQDSDLYGLTLRSWIGENSVWTNKVYYRKSDKISSEGEAFPDFAPEGSPASSFPVRENIITIGEGETEIGWRSDFETTNQWGLLSAGDHKRIESNRFGDDEVGMLAETIEKTLEQISAFIVRERYFTGSASHELRTPLTVITGALELLEQSNLSPADEKVLARVRRATHEMRTTIEMFLCLARETDDGLYEEQFSVMPMVSQAVEQQRYLLNGKFVDVEIDALAKPIVCGHPQAFSIAINNLVRNAFEHTLDEQGLVTVRVKDNELLVTNQISSEADERHTPIETPSQGYGLGLGIVQRMCECNGWSFSLLSDEKRVIARLSW